MRRDQMYAIGQAAEICDVSIQTLRYYDKIGLVKPEHVDRQSGYRYYSSRNLLHVKIVKEMKLMNFSLEQIAAMLEQGAAEGMKAAYALKHAELLQQQQELERARLMVEQRLKQIDELEQLSADLTELDVLIELKQLPDRCVVYDRGWHGIDMEPAIARFVGLFRLMEMNGLQPTGSGMSIYHEELLTLDRSRADIEVCVMIAAEIPASSLTRIVPGGRHVTATYCGAPNEQSCKHAYGRMQEWMTLHGYQANGPMVEQYLIDMTQMMNPNDFIVELQIPVKHSLTL
ncbi:MerR family transcriptional regulator [Paenibacillus sp. PR3]|uniref:MerR family transcriptional regulator n=1 Tax=Paenibacillus terricola TaxID=2763503 RepID=A0ABR8N262_9BACL|nr:MerR family transcriptional regulator [Paenibacillus terricola]MBD3920554.1 MerR family transcriptional regulator [Paenibacillus terricola]